jgi:hypothetical protein
MGRINYLSFPCYFCYDCDFMKCPKCSFVAEVCTRSPDPDIPEFIYAKETSEHILEPIFKCPNCGFEFE